MKILDALNRYSTRSFLAYSASTVLFAKGILDQTGYLTSMFAFLGYRLLKQHLEKKVQP